MTTITREQQKQILIDTANHVISRDNTSPYSENLRELARIALASLTAEPVAWKYRLVDIDSGTGDHWKYSTQCITPASGKTHRIESVPLYTVSQPVPEREQVRREYAKWSDKTFGDIGPVGPLKHLSKEALEAAADPSDPLEWADMQFLLWDAQRRMGLSDEFITRAMIEKLEINKSRQWPEPKDGEPHLHIKEQPVPVVPEDISGIIERFRYQADHLSDWHHIDEHSCKVNRRDLMTALEFMDSCRAAMLQGSQPVSNRDELQVIGWLRSDYNSDDKCDPNAPLFMLGRNDPSETWGVKYIPLSGNSPVIPGGWISCSEQMPDREYVLAGDFSGTHYLASIPNVQVGIYADWFDDGKHCWDDGDGNDLHLKEVTHWMPLPEPPQEVK
ncbi:DUF550 domain-containing protein [Salmonella enterica subsp. salamae]|nr:DUF550 domain-containing protein [Salmonella enterica subsp. salamae]ECC8833614.1 DUF550 domain-containing protein [Salmonella enterica subsp. salamae]